MYKIHSHKIDGDSTERFKNLGQVARYVRTFDQGSDYRRPGYLQDDYGPMYFKGFDWSDLLDGPFWKQDSQYKPELLKKSIRLTWHRRRGLKTWEDCRDGARIIGSVFRCTGATLWTACLGNCCPTYLPSQKSLSEAKKAVREAFRNESE
jgi:hypothetical protein